MPSGEAIQQYIAGCWRLMNGKPDGVRMLDTSADGFWNSFFAILLAVPALGVGWVMVANELGGDNFGERLSVVARVALTDVAGWVLPIALLALVARPVGIASRFVHYVVATNWASLLLVWILMPSGLIRLLWPDWGGFATMLALGIYMATLVLLWRLTNAVLDMGPAVASGVFVGMFAVSFALVILLQELFGLTPPP